MEREIPAHAEAALIGFGGNDIDYDWRAVAANTRTRSICRIPAETFLRTCDAMVCLTRSRGMETITYDLTAHRRRTLLRMDRP